MLLLKSSEGGSASKCKMSDDRNFRAHYYDKVGFRVVEQKKSLEILLKEKPFDLSKLSEFCHRFSLPSMYRTYVWKLLLDVLPANPESHQGVTHERKEQCSDLRHSLKVMRKIDINTPASHVLVLMFLLEEGTLMLNHKQQLSEPTTENLISLASAFTKMDFPDEDDAYWLMRNFYKFQSKFSHLLPTLASRLEDILHKEDPELYQHLVKIQTLKALPVNKWFGKCFAEVLHENSLGRLWDKIIGGAFKILAYVGAAILITLRRPLFAMQGADEVMNYLHKVPEDTSDLVVNKALDMWQVKPSITEARK